MTAELIALLREAGVDLVIHAQGLAARSFSIGKDESNFTIGLLTDMRDGQNQAVRGDDDATAAGSIDLHGHHCRGDSSDQGLYVLFDRLEVIERRRGCPAENGG